jgi:maltose/moltooligosaccharide transporter
MEPYRAFIADKLDDKQMPLGFQMQSFFTGFEETLANLLLFFPMILLEKQALAYLGICFFLLRAVCSIGVSGGV